VVVVVVAAVVVVVLTLTAAMTRGRVHYILQLWIKAIQARDNSKFTHTPL
jgi:hypothetical protein